MALTQEQFNELYSKGLSVEQIVSFEQGNVPQGPSDAQISQQQNAPTFPATGQENPAQAGLKSLGNVPSSLYNVGKGLVGAMANPIDTVKSIGSIGLGAVQKLIPGQQGREQSFDSVVDFYKQRYGTLEKAQLTATNDPFGFGADLLGIISGATGLLGKANVLNEVSALNKVSPALRNIVQKSTFKLSPTQASKMGESVNNASQWLSENKVVGTATSRAQKTQNILDGYEAQIERTLQKAGKDVTVPKQSLVQGLDELKASDLFADDVNLLQIQRKIDKTKARIELFPNEIPVDRLNNFKRSSFKKSYDKQGNLVLDPVNEQVGQIAYNSLSEALKNAGIKINNKDIRAFNQNYASGINAKKILDITKNKNNIGFFGKIASGAMGAYLGSMINPWFGTAIGASVGPAVGGGLSGGLDVLKTGIATQGRNIPTQVGGALNVPNALSPEQDYLNNLGL